MLPFIIIAVLVVSSLWYIDRLHDWHILQLATSGMKRKARMMRARGIDLLNPTLIHDALKDVVNNATVRCRDVSAAQDYLTQQIQSILKRNRT